MWNIPRSNSTPTFIDPRKDETEADLALFLALRCHLDHANTRIRCYHDYLVDNGGLQVYLRLR